MPKLPVVSGKQFIKFMRRHGWTVAGQKGSHIRMTKPGFRSVVVTDKPEMSVEVVKGNLKTAAINRREFEDYFVKGKRGGK